MASIQLIGRPGLVADDESYINAPGRSWWPIKMADAANYLNFHARKVLPYTRWEDTAVVSACETIYPIDGPSYATRYLTVVVGVRDISNDNEGTITVTTTTDSVTGHTRTYQSSGGSGSSNWTPESENGIGYFLFRVQATGGQQEQVIITGVAGTALDGFGIWELPPKKGGGVADSGTGGYSSHLAAIDDGVTDALDPRTFSSVEDIDLDISSLQTSIENARNRNRRIIFAAGAVDASGGTGNLQLHTDSPNNAGSWVSLPTSGIYIPSYHKAHGATTRNIRAVVQVINRDVTVTNASAWRIETSQGNYGSDTWNGTALQWRPSGTPYNAATDGVQATVGTSAEWIKLGLKEAATGGGDPAILGIVIWEDDI